MTWPGQRGSRRCAAAMLVAAFSLTAACQESQTSSPSATGPKPVAGIRVGETNVTVAAAGDIARRPDDGEATAALIEALRPDAVLALGDTAYDSGSPEEFAEKYDPTWGAFKTITRPIPGNHEYKTPGAAGYFDYFQRQIGDREYYAWDAGSWRMYALNCEIDCGRTSEQVRWLTDDLASNDHKPALAYVHSPLYTCSTRHPPARRLDDIWKALRAGQGQLVLSGDNHAYERFAPQDEAGRRSPEGLQQFVVGTGGAPHYPVRDKCPNREAASDSTDGVLILDLGTDRYSWQFVAVDGAVLDSGMQRIG